MALLITVPDNMEGNHSCPMDGSPIKLSPFSKGPRFVMANMIWSLIRPGPSVLRQINWSQAVVISLNILSNRVEWR